MLAFSQAAPPREYPQRGPTKSQDFGHFYKVPVHVDWVELPVNVWDNSSRRFVTGLQAEDFRVFEDGVEQEVLQISIEHVPYNLLLLLDMSGSMDHYQGLINAAATRFVEHTSPKDRIAVAKFGSSVQLMCGFTKDRKVVGDAINRTYYAYGTCFYDALEKSVTKYFRNIGGRKAVVVITDGFDNRYADGGFPGGGSRISYEKMFTTLDETDVMVYPIWIDTKSEEARRLAKATRAPGRGKPRAPSPWPVPHGSPSPLPEPRMTLPYPLPTIVSRIPAVKRVKQTRAERDAEEDRRLSGIALDQLESIAMKTGGLMYVSKNLDDLAPVYDAIAEALRTQYLICYRQPNAEHMGWRKTRVELVTNPGGWAVRTSLGHHVGTSKPAGK